MTFRVKVRASQQGMDVKHVLTSIVKTVFGGFRHLTIQLLLEGSASVLGLN